MQVRSLVSTCTSGNKIMKAAQFEPGGPENLKIGEVPIPDLREREVLIKVYATAINRADTLQVCV